MARRGSFDGFYHTHLNPNWTPRGKEAFTVLFPGWQCAATSTDCPFVNHRESKRSTPAVLAGSADKQRSKPTTNARRPKTRRVTRRVRLAKRASRPTVQLETKR